MFPVTSSFASWLYYLGDARRASFANQSPSRAEGTGRRCAGLSTNAAADTKRCRAATGTHAPQKGWLLPFLRSGQPRRAARSHVPRPSKSKRVQIMCPSGTSAFQWRGVREQRVTRFSCANSLPVSVLAAWHMIQGLDHGHMSSLSSREVEYRSM